MTKQIFLKKKSKRLSCRKRYKIEKKVREHTRKVRKESKKIGSNSKKRKEKPLESQIPNKCPFKEEILREAIQKTEVQAAARQLRREEVKQKRVQARKEAVAKKRTLTTNVTSIEELAKQAEDRGDSFTCKNKGVTAHLLMYKNMLISERMMEEFERTSMANKHDQSTKTYVAEVKKVIEQADVVLQVLDARDPLGSRCAALEQMVLSNGKKLVLLINKIDLVPKDNIAKWLVYLRKEFPTLAFKASTQEQKRNLGRTSKSLSINSSKCIGADLLLKLMGNYCRNKDIKTCIRVGVVGFPNVGKSSIINSLKRSRTCSVGATPGVTKNIQEIELDSNVRLLDSPGVVLLSKSALDPIEVALKNAVRVESLPDPTAVVQAVLRRCSKDTLMLQYNIADFEDCHAFLVSIARRFGLLKKGAAPDMDAAARKILNDWNGGKLRYYTIPPEIMVSDQSTSLIINKMSDEFNLEGLEADQNDMMQELNPTGVSDIVLFKSNGVVKGGLVDEDEDDNMEGEGEEGEGEEVGSDVRVAPLAPKRAGSPSATVTKVKFQDELVGNRRLDAVKKVAFKKKKKRAKRIDKLSTELSLGIQQSMDLDEV